MEDVKAESKKYKELNRDSDKTRTSSHEWVKLKYRKLNRQIGAKYDTSAKKVMQTYWQQERKIKTIVKHREGGRGSEKE